jgi:hypothetical protein
VLFSVRLYINKKNEKEKHFNFLLNKNKVPLLQRKKEIHVVLLFISSFVFWWLGHDFVCVCAGALMTESPGEHHITLAVMVCATTAAQGYIVEGQLRWMLQHGTLDQHVLFVPYDSVDEMPSSSSAAAGASVGITIEQYNSDDDDDDLKYAVCGRGQNGSAYNCRGAHKALETLCALATAEQRVRWTIVSPDCKREIADALAACVASTVFEEAIREQCEESAAADSFMSSLPEMKMELREALSSSTYHSSNVSKMFPFCMVWCEGGATVRGTSTENTANDVHYLLAQHYARAYRNVCAAAISPVQFKARRHIISIEHGCQVIEWSTEAIDAIRLEASRTSSRSREEAADDSSECSRCPTAVQLCFIGQKAKTRAVTVDPLPPKVGDSGESRDVTRACCIRLDALTGLCGYEWCKPAEANALVWYGYECAARTFYFRDMATGTAVRRGDLSLLWTIKRPSSKRCYYGVRIFLVIVVVLLILIATIER